MGEYTNDISLSRASSTLTFVMNVNSVDVDSFVINSITGNFYDIGENPLELSLNNVHTNNNLKSDVWKIVKVNIDNLSPSIYNRRLKLLYPYTELKGYDYSLYVDGSIQIKSDVFTFLAKYIDKKPVLMNFKHPSNDDIFKEMISCIKEGRGNAEKLIEQYNIYINDGMPRYYGLSDNKIILRYNHSQLGEILMNEWLDHVVKYSGRDQVCLSYVLWKHNIHYFFIMQKELL
jgi:hypothetical protein